MSTLKYSVFWWTLHLSYIWIHTHTHICNSVTVCFSTEMLFDSHPCTSPTPNWSGPHLATRQRGRDSTAAAAPPQISPLRLLQNLMACHTSTTDATGVTGSRCFTITKPLLRLHSPATGTGLGWQRRDECSNQHRDKEEQKQPTWWRKSKNKNVGSGVFFKSPNSRHIFKFKASIAHNWFISLSVI